MHVAAGTATSFAPDVRLILASNKDLAEEVEQKRLLHDLVRRINENYTIEIPALVVSYAD
jgi:DNA-binding NtrC family response regulator